MYQQRANNISSDISNWLTAYLQKSNRECFVVGVSGGIDSAVVSMLCANTGIQTYVLNLPIHSKTHLSALSDLHCTQLQKKYNNITSLTIDGTAVYDALTLAVAPHNIKIAPHNIKIAPHNIEIAPQGPTDTLSGANAKSRIRMTMLYYIAGERRGIVVGTGNKVEDFGVGFFTKYGDGGVDISPIAALSKTQVRTIGEVLGVDKQILQAPPTDGLWEDNRTDEEQIGASYEELEWAMEHIDTHPTGNDSTLSKREKEVMNIYFSFHEKNKHKMQAIPVFIPD